MGHVRSKQLPVKLDLKGDICRTFFLYPSFLPMCNLLQQSNRFQLEYFYYTNLQNHTILNVSFIALRVQSANVHYTRLRTNVTGVMMDL